MTKMHISGDSIGEISTDNDSSDGNLISGAKKIGGDTNIIKEYVQKQIDIIYMTEWLNAQNVEQSMSIVELFMSMQDIDDAQPIYKAWKLKLQKMLYENYDLCEIANGNYLNESKTLIGFYLAIENILDYIMNRRKKEQLINNHISSSQYYLKILQLLYEKKYMTQKELAQTLGVSITNLSNILKRLQASDLFDFIKHGREKIYRLTTDGEEFCKSHFKNND